MFVYCECCVLTCRGLCDKLITRLEESYRLWYVVVHDLDNFKNDEAMTRVGSQRHRIKNIPTINNVILRNIREHFFIFFISFWERYVPLRITHCVSVCFI
jgi:hypothetical protein